MTPCRRGARRAIGLGLLIPGLLLVPHGAQAADAPAKPATKQPDPKTAKIGAPASAATDPCVYIVRSGDSVSKIAARQRVPRQRIIDANQLTKPEALRVGRRLIIPGCDPTRARWWRSWARAAFLPGSISMSPSSAIKGWSSPGRSWGP